MSEPRTSVACLCVCVVVLGSVARLGLQVTYLVPESFWLPSGLKGHTVMVVVMESRSPSGTRALTGQIYDC